MILTNNNHNIKLTIEYEDIYRTIIVLFYQQN